MVSDPVCGCGHRRSEHNADWYDQDDGCLYGWGGEGRDGCFCERFRIALPVRVDTPTRVDTRGQ